LWILNSVSLVICLCMVPCSLLYVQRFSFESLL
jgi:hypothetical protein